MTRRVLVFGFLTWAALLMGSVMAVKAQPSGTLFAYKTHLSPWDGQIYYFGLLADGDLYFRDNLGTAAVLSGNIWNGATPSSPLHDFDFVQKSSTFVLTIYLFLENGDLHAVNVDLGVGRTDFGKILTGSHRFIWNFWGGGTVSTKSTTWGRIKETYKQTE